MHIQSTADPLERSPSHRRRCLPMAALLASLLLGFWQTPSAYTASFIVDSTADTVDLAPGDGICADLSGSCTIRAAIIETNALAGPDTITVPAGTYGLSIPGRLEEASAQGDLDITDSLVVRGAGAPVTIVDGGGLDRVFHMPTVNHVILSDLTVQNGETDAGDGGGGIFNGQGNQPGGLLELTNVTVSSNTSTFGGGIINGWGARMRLRGVTVSNNTGGAGGGIYTRDGGLVHLTNSTVSNNRALGQAGGIDAWFNAQVRLVNCTIVQNDAPFGSGILAEGPNVQVELAASIIADNSGDANCSGVLIVSRGSNLDSDATCSLTQATDLPATDPALGPLQDNGGPTKTHALLPGSPAIDHIDCRVSTDQRGVARPQGPACDVGAYEVRQ